MFFTSGWIGLHVLVWSAAVGMVLLGRWQLDVSNSKHFDAQNFSYALQWWAFAAFAVGIWAKAIRDTLRNRQPQASTSGELTLASRSDRPGTGVAYSGPAELVARAKPGQAPTVYRGYVMRQSSTSPARTDGDPLRSEYNDYLWQLALADSAGSPDRRPRSAPAKSAEPSEPSESADATEPAEIEPAAEG
jgi:DNA-binding transcriptional regulator of glucitol operon